MNKVIRIGTRDSQLALWQAHTVENQLQALGYKTQIVPAQFVFYTPRPVIDSQRCALAIKQVGYLWCLF